MTNLIFAFVVTLVFAACSPTPPAVSPSFHGLPEDGAAMGSDDLAKDEEVVGPLTEDYVDATSAALEDGDALLPGLVPSSTHALTTDDHVPWHMEYLLTDLSVSAGGLLGGLVMKGSPAVTFVWRKQKSETSPDGLHDVALAAETDLSISGSTTDADISMQLEPAIKMALRSGRVKSESKFRSSLTKAAHDFQTLGQSIGENPGHEFWVSRLRLDLTLDATGAVTPVIGVGGDLRFRFEWHRIMRAGSSPTAPKKILGVAPSSLRSFIGATAQDLSALADDTPRPDGFKAYAYKVGIGMSAKGDIGIVKSSASLMGQVYFTRDVSKPKVHSFTAELLPDTVNVIEEAAAVHSAAHESFAVAHAIEAHREARESGDQVVYKVDRKKIRKGLARAAKMGLMFGRHAATATKGHWKVFEIRTAIDLSITGKIGLTELSGQATGEIYFYNQSF